MWATTSSNTGATQLVMTVVETATVPMRCTATVSLPIAAAINAIDASGARPRVSMHARSYSARRASAGETRPACQTAADAASSEPTAAAPAVRAI